MEADATKPTATRSRYDRIARLAPNDEFARSRPADRERSQPAPRQRSVDSDSESEGGRGSEDEVAVPRTALQPPPFRRVRV